jgi:hypothetical protein
MSLFDIVPAFLVLLLSGMLCQVVLFMVASNIQVFITAKASPEADCDERLLLDEFEVGFEPVQTV